MLHLTPQLFRVLAKKGGEEFTPEINTLDSGAQVLNLTVVPVDSWDGEADVYIQAAIWGRKGEQLSGYAKHMDEFLFGGACKIEADSDNPKVHYYKLNVNTSGPFSRVKRTRLVPAEVSEDMESDLEAAKKAASSKAKAEPTPADDDENIPF